MIRFLLLWFGLLYAFAILPMTQALCPGSEAITEARLPERSAIGQVYRLTRTEGRGHQCARSADLRVGGDEGGRRHGRLLLDRVQHLRRHGRSAAPVDRVHRGEGEVVQRRGGRRRDRDGPQNSAGGARGAPGARAAT